MYRYNIDDFMNDLTALNLKYSSSNDNKDLIDILELREFDDLILSDDSKNRLKIMKIILNLKSKYLNNISSIDGYRDSSCDGIRIYMNVALQKVLDIRFNKKVRVDEFVINVKARYNSEINLRLSNSRGFFIATFYRDQFLIDSRKDDIKETLKYFDDEDDSNYIVDSIIKVVATELKGLNLKDSYSVAMNILSSIVDLYGMYDELSTDFTSENLSSPIITDDDLLNHMYDTMKISGDLISKYMNTQLATNSISNRANYAANTTKSGSITGNITGNSISISGNITGSTISGPTFN